MYLGSFYCKAIAVYKHDMTQIVLGDLSDVYDPLFGGFLTEDGTETGTPYYGLYVPQIFAAGHIRMVETLSLDNIEDGEIYGRVAISDIEAGHIKLAECIGSIDDIAEGENYGKVALTSISGGKIIVAGLDANVTKRMFKDPTSKESIEAWMHSADATFIDGGKIYTNSITAEQINVESLDAISADLGKVTAGELNGVQLNGASIDSSNYQTEADAYGVHVTIYGGTVGFQANGSSFVLGLTRDQYGRLNINNDLIVNGNAVSYEGHSHSEYALESELGGYALAVHTHSEYVTSLEMATTIQEALQNVQQDIDNINTKFDSAYSGYFEIMSNGDSLGITVENGLITNVATV